MLDIYFSINFITRPSAAGSLAQRGDAVGGDGGAPLHQAGGFTVY